MIVKYDGEYKRLKKQVLGKNLKLPRHSNQIRVIASKPLKTGLSELKEKRLR